MASTATEDVMNTEARMPDSSLITFGSCRPISRNANDSRISTRACHSAKSCSRVAYPAWVERWPRISAATTTAITPEPCTHSATK